MAFPITACAITKYLLIYALKIAHFFTTTDRLRRSPLYLDLSPSCAHSLLWSFMRLHGVNHNTPFPTAISLHKIFTTDTPFFSFSVLSDLPCFQSVDMYCCLPAKHAKGMSLGYDANFTHMPTVVEIFAFGIICLGYVIKAERIKEILDIIP